MAFSASRADLYTRSASSSGSQNIVFDRTETEVGYGWNRGRGVFVCQDPGVYAFSWSADSPSGTEAGTVGGACSCVRTPGCASSHGLLSLPLPP